MKTVDFIKSEKMITDKSLEVFLAAKKTELVEIDPILENLIKAVSDQFLTGGKRLRPLLFRLGYQLAGGQIEPKIIRASLFVELMHAYILVHDDIADRDYKRYGKPTLEVVFNKSFEKQFGFANSHFGTSIAMVTADLINTLAHQSLLESGLEPKQIIACEKLMAQTLHQVVGGWYLHQIQNHQPLAQVSPERYLEGMKLVSASYTVESPLKMGATLNQDSQINLDALADYAFHVGMGFQIQDDILGVFGKTEVTGKPVGNDIREGKKTLLILDAYKRTSSKKKQRLETLVGKNINQDELEEVQELIDKTGALQASKDKAHEHINQALKAVADINGDPNTQNTLTQLAEFMIVRDY